MSPWDSLIGVRAYKKTHLYHDDTPRSCTHTEEAERRGTSDKRAYCTESTVTGLHKSIFSLEVRCTWPEEKDTSRTKGSGDERRTDPSFSLLSQAHSEPRSEHQRHMRTGGDRRHQPVPLGLPTSTPETPLRQPETRGINGDVSLLLSGFLSTSPGGLWGTCDWTKSSIISSRDKEP